MPGLCWFNENPVLPSQTVLDSPIVLVVKTIAAILSIFTLLSPRAEAQQAALEERVRALEEKLAIQAAVPSAESEELTRLKMELQLPETLSNGFTGLGPAASKVYSSRSPIAFGGMAEANYRAPTGGSKSTSLTRTDLFAGARLSENIVFNSALSFGDQDSALAAPVNPATRVTYAYVDFLFREESGLRVGHVLIPFGVTNLKFEPTMYATIRRPRAEELLIPSAWRENGVLAFWRHGGFLFQTGVVNSGDISQAQSATWIRGGRQYGANAKAETLAWVARFETVSQKPDNGSPEPGIGLSIYAGDWAQGNKAQFGDARVILAEAHAGYRVFDRLLVQALWVEGRLSDTERIYASTNQALGQETRGGTFTASWDLLPPLAHTANNILDRDATPTVFRELPIFISYEFVRNQAKLAANLPSDPLAETRVWTVGVNYRPHSQVVVKTGYAHERDGAGREAKGLEAAIGITF